MTCNEAEWAIYVVKEGSLEQYTFHLFTEHITQQGESFSDIKDNLDKAMTNIIMQV